MTSHAAHLMYDSDRAGSTVGVRANATEGRSLCFRSVHFTVDLMLQQVDPALEVMHGQVVHEASGSPIRFAEVRLGEEGEPVHTDEYGQFTLSGLRDGDDRFVWIHTPDARLLCTIPSLKRRSA